MTERHERWPNTGRVPRGSRWDTPRPEVAAMEEAIHPSDGDEPEGIPMTGVDGLAGPGKNPRRAEGADGKPAEADEDEDEEDEPDTKPAGRKGSKKATENS